MLIICAVLVRYMSSQKGEFTFRPCPIQLHVCLTPVLEENILLVTFVHKLSL